MAISDLHIRALAYVRNAGGSPEVTWFDEDHEPIGESLRNDLLKANLIRIVRDRFVGCDVIVLTIHGERIVMGVP